MCAVHAPWISCCNHFYLLNYVKPFFYPTGVSLFIFSLSASVMVTSFLIQRIQIKAQRRSWHGRFQSEAGIPPYSFFFFAGRYTALQENQNVSKEQCMREDVFASPERVCRRILLSL